ncbi:MAG: nucleolar RNA-binding Nop10p family protein [Candidatus Micrarchaeota archaeon]
MQRCLKCGAYTLKEKCSKCSCNTANPHPAKYSHDDKYAAYRRKAKGLT